MIILHKELIFILLSQLETERGAHICRSSSFEMLTDVNPAVAVFDKVNMECEYVNPPSCLNASAGSGLDSDFGASAGMIGSSAVWYGCRDDLLLLR